MEKTESAPEEKNVGQEISSITPDQTVLKLISNKLRYEKNKLLSQSQSEDWNLENKKKEGLAPS